MLDVEAIKTAIPIEKVIGQYIHLKKDGSRYVALCPFHSERTPSFTVTPSMGIYKCFGCDASGDAITFIEKMEAKPFQAAAKLLAEMAGLSDIASQEPTPANMRPIAIVRQPVVVPDKQPIPPKHVATYEYVSATGELLYEVLRYEPGKNGKAKDFRQRRRMPDGSWAWGINAGRYRRSARGDWFPTAEVGDEDQDLPDVERVLFRLPVVTESFECVVVEGEKDVLTLEQVGFVATTNSGGSKQPWLDSYSEALRGRRVIIFPDNDAPGEAHGRKIEKSLEGIASEVVYVPLPKGFKDVTEYVNAGRTAADIRALIAEVEDRQVEADRRRRGLLPAIEVLFRHKGGIDAFLDPAKRPKGLLTGFHKFDEMTLGLHAGELMVLAARPAMGKTTLALNIAHSIAARKESTVAVFSLEMASEALMERIVCSRSGVDSMKFRSGYCRPDELKNIREATSAVSEMPIFFDDYPPYTISEIRRRLSLLAEKQEIGLVVIDYLQLLSSEKRSNAANRVAEVSEQSRALKLMCREFNAPILALSQLSRACEVRPGDHRPILSDLRDSGSIEQDCDLCAFLYRKEVYRPDLEQARGKAELILAKQRNGPTGKVYLEFKNSLNRFENPTSEWDLNDQ